MPKDRKYGILQRCGVNPYNRNYMQIIYETNDFLAINKPAGVLVHPAKSGDTEEGTVVGWLRKEYPEIHGVGDPPVSLRDPKRAGESYQHRPGIVHRLDKDTSGILLIAKTQEAFEYLKHLFQTRQIEKTYLALVYGKVTGRGKIDKPIGIKSGSMKRSVNAKTMKAVKNALTEYRTVKQFQKGEYTLLRVSPKTGKTHQIRVHLASIGHPVVGDTLYGGKKRGNPFGLTRQFLHAESIEFTAPDGSRIHLEAELPPDLEEALERAAHKTEQETIVEY